MAFDRELASSSGQEALSEEGIEVPAGPDSMDEPVAESGSIADQLLPLITCTREEIGGDSSMRFRILAETVSRICEAASRGSASVGCETIHFDKVQSLPFRCLGVWGPSDDLWQFLIEKLRLPSSGKTEAESWPPGLYVVRKTVVPDSLEITVVLLPAQDGFPAGGSKGINCTLLAYLFQISTTKVCLFNAPSAAALYPDNFPFEEDEAIELIQIGLEQRRERENRIILEDSFVLDLPARPAAVPNEPKISVFGAAGDVIVCSSVECPGRRMLQGERITISQEDFPAHIQDMLQEVSIVLKMTPARESARKTALFLRHALPDQWRRVEELETMIDKASMVHLMDGQSCSVFGIHRTFVDQWKVELRAECCNAYHRIMGFIANGQLSYIGTNLQVLSTFFESDGAKYLIDTARTSLSVEALRALAERTHYAEAIAWFKYPDSTAERHKKDFEKVLREINVSCGGDLERYINMFLEASPRRTYLEALWNTLGDTLGWDRSKKIITREELDHQVEVIRGAQSQDKILQYYRELEIDKLMDWFNGSPSLDTAIEDAIHRRVKKTKHSVEGLKKVRERVMKDLVGGLASDGGRLQFIVNNIKEESEGAVVTDTITRKPPSITLIGQREYISSSGVHDVHINGWSIEAKQEVDPAAEPVAPKERPCFHDQVNGEVLFFDLIDKAHAILVIKASQESTTSIYILPRRGERFSFTRNTRPAVQMQRLIALVAFDPRSRMVACYDRDSGVIMVYSFHEDWTNKSNSYSVRIDHVFNAVGDSPTSLSCMSLVGALRYIVLVAETGEVSIVDIRQNVPLPWRLSPSSCVGDAGVQCLVSSAGPTLLVISPATGNEDGNASFRLEAYMLKSTALYAVPICKGPTALLLSGVLSKESIFSLCCLGTQEHLITYNRASERVHTFALTIETEEMSTRTVSTVTRYGHDDQGTVAKPTADCSNGRLDVIFHCLDKFAVQTGLDLPIAPSLLVLLLDLSQSHLPAGTFHRYTERIFAALTSQSKKDASALKIQVVEANWSSLKPEEYGHIDVSSSWGDNIPRPMADWLTSLISLVPLQIARAMNNELKALSDGAPIEEEEASDVDQLSSLIRFGMYEAVLRHYGARPVVVVSAIGNQSTGKSYMLNHLAGCYFDSAGGRCTDGCWMTVRVTDERVYVLLDFEGLGSFERTEQEDMFLGLLASALSSITLFKSHFHFDRYTEQTFRRFNLGATKCRHWSGKLFKGTLCVVLKDVERSDQHSVNLDYNEKFKRCTQEQDNFLTNLFNGRATVMPFPIFKQPSFFRHLNTLGRIVAQTSPTFPRSDVFLNITRLLLAKLDFVDWTSIDKDRIRQRITALSSQLLDACSAGVSEYGLLPSQTDSELTVVTTSPLSSLDDRADVPDPGLLELNLVLLPSEVPQCQERPHILSVVTLSAERESEGSLHDSSPSVCNVDVTVEGLPDAAILLGSTSTQAHTQLELFAALRTCFQELIYPLSPHNAALWHGNFKSFIEAVISRRERRLTQWYKGNTQSFADTQQGREFAQRVLEMMEKIRLSWKACDFPKCSQCYYPCTLPSSHEGKHDCGGSHSCEGYCRYCSGAGMEEAKGNDTTMVQPCLLPSGHPGSCTCMDKSHVCGRPCYLSEVASGCSGACQKAPGHENDPDPEVQKCLCPSLKHLCGQVCDLPECMERCVEVYGVVHDRHACHKTACGVKCPLCNDTCSSRNHFHAVEQPGAIHLCGREHRCVNLCSAEGVCSIQAVRKAEEQLFEGKRANIKYYYTEYRANRLRCTKTIPVGSLAHEGACIHDEDESVIHTCSICCPNCEYPCELPHGHEGRHKTNHGNMRNAQFVAQEGDEVDLDLDLTEGRLYRAGDLCIAENCDLYCAKLGRGHMHILPCSKECQGLLSDGIRHAARPYGDKVVDEVKHDTYCDLLGWEDWCSQLPRQERESFRQCPYICHHPSHTEGGNDEQVYCTLDLWHRPADPNGQIAPGHYVSRHGHVFPCQHQASAMPCSTYFIVDRSGSMGDASVTPTLPFLTAHEGLRTRLGAVLEATHHYVARRLALGVADTASLIVFHTQAQCLFEQEAITPDLVRQHATQVRPSGCTYFSEGLKLAYERLGRHRLSVASECCICLHALQQPMQFRGCRHTFCHDCITVHLERNGNNCPLCRVRVSRNDLMAVASLPSTLEEQLQMGAGRRCRERPIFILLSDGHDHVKEATLREVRQMCDREEALYHDCTCWGGEQGRRSCPSTVGHRLVIHTVGFGAGVDGNHLQALAERMAGSYTQTYEDLPSICQAFTDLADAPDKKGKCSVGVMARTPPTTGQP